MGNSPIVALEVLENAEVAKRSMPTEELTGWMLLGDAPLLAKAALSYAIQVADGKVDVEAVFQRALGMRRWTILKAATGGGRR